MHIILNKVLTGIVVWWIKWYFPYTLFTDSLIHKTGYERNGFFGRLYILYTVIFVLSLVAHATHSHIHTRMPSFKTVHNAQTNITLRAKIQCAHSFVVHCTHTATTLFLFWGPTLGMFHFQATFLGYRWTWSPSRYATWSHILLMGFRNQITNKNLPQPFVSFFHHMFYGAGRHWGWSYLLGGKTVYLSTSMFSWQFHKYSPSYLICPHIPCERYSPLLHEVWLHGQICRRNRLPLEEYAYFWEHRHTVYPSSVQYFDLLWPVW